MTTQASLWIVAAGGGLLAIVATLADRLRTRRRDLDRTGWMPWTGLSLVGLFAALIALGLAIRA